MSRPALPAALPASAAGHIGHSLAECCRGRTRVTIIAILRDSEPIAGAQPSDVVKPGDTLVTVGKRALTDE